MDLPFVSGRICLEFFERNIELRSYARCGGGPARACVIMTELENLLMKIVGRLVVGISVCETLKSSGQLRELLGVIQLSGDVASVVTDAD